MRGFLKTVNNFLKNTSLNGYGYITEKNRTRSEKYFWIGIEILIMSVTIFLFVNVWQQFMNNPTVTSLETTAYRVENVPFPAVSICNTNKISKRRIEKLIDDMKSVGIQLSKKLIDNFRLLGNFYEYELHEADQLVNLQNVFQIYQTKKNISKNQFSVHHLLKSLITPCDELLNNCWWGGKSVNCSDIFSERLTYEGYCCTFNYIKDTKAETDNQLIPQTEAYTQSAGTDKGLSILINNEPEDYYYPILSFIGTIIHIFHPPDYPDIFSGSLTQCLSGSGMETFIAISPTTIYAVNDIVRYSVDKRNCIFAEEKSTVLGNYTESDCKVDCRIKSMLALCDCIPFMIPTTNERTCTLTDLPCLSKYQGKWSSTYPFNAEDVEELKRERQDALRCDSICYPACDVTIYDVAINTIPLAKVNNSLENIENSLLHIYFKSPVSDLYKKDVVLYWFEILAYFGGLGGLTIGVSLISVVELIVFFIFKGYYF